MFRELLDRILPGSWRIANPLWTMTKRQAVRLLEKEIGKKRATEITSVTQSCWNLWAPQVFGVRKFDRSEKKPNEHCGVCIPCIVRRTALPEDHFAFDLRHDSVRNHPKLGAHFLEYLELVSAVRASRTTADLRTVIPAEGLELIDDGYIDLGSLENLLREFSKEFHETFF